MKGNLSDDLSIIGLRMGKGKESRVLTVLRAVLDAYEDQEDAVTFGEIYEILTHESDFKASKAWVHRILKNLVEMGLIRLEVPDALRKKYIANLVSVVTGLEKLKDESREDLDSQIGVLKERMKRMKDVDCGAVAQEFVEFLTGKKQRLSSRFVTGVDELHRVLENNIHGPAGPGDIIRSTMSWSGPFMQGSDKRMMKYFDSAKKGVDVRWLVDVVVFLSIDHSEAISVQIASRMLREVIYLQKAGYKIQINLYKGGSTYNQSSLNDEHVALIITEEPVTATFVTREFNKDLIDDVIRNFDDFWKGSVPLLGATPKQMEELGLLESPFLVETMKKLQKTNREAEE